MSWSSNGTTLLEEIISVLSDELEDDQKERVYQKLIKLFADEDCDVEDMESEDPIFETALSEFMGDDFNEDESDD